MGGTTTEYTGYMYPPSFLAGWYNGYIDLDSIAFISVLLCPNCAVNSEMCSQNREIVELTVNGYTVVWSELLYTRRRLTAFLTIFCMIALTAYENCNSSMYVSNIVHFKYVMPPRPMTSM